MGQNPHRPGFTLTELLLTIATIAVLAVIVVTAVNPSKQLGDSQDARRSHNVNQLKKALFQYLIDYREFPGNPAIPENAANARAICRAGFAESGGSPCVNLDMLLSFNYLSCIPHDGLESDTDDSGYAVYQEAGRAHVVALHYNKGSAESACETLPKPIAYWKLDEMNIGDTVIDASVNGYDGSHEGIVPPEGPYEDTPNTIYANERSVRIDQGDYIDVGDFNVAGNTLTLTAWFKADQFLYDPRMIDKAEGASLDGVYWMLGINDSSTTDGTIRFRVYTDVGGAATLEGGTAEVNTWTHIAGVYDGSDMYLFKNGVEIASVPKTGLIRTGSASVWLGANPPDVWQRKHDGFVDDVRVYNTALAGGQILSLFQGNP